jgi:Tfp pilus assembly protein PilN
VIKVNLLKNYGAASSEILLQLEEQKSTNRTFAKNMVVMTLGALGLFIYENYNIPQLTDQQTALQAQLSELENFNQKKEALKLEIEKYENDRIRLNRQTEFLQRIQRERNLTVDLMSKIKEVIPSSVWILSIGVNDKKIEIKGEAEADRDINEFNNRLSTVPFLKDVIVLSIELRSTNDKSKSAIKTFTLSASFADLSTVLNAEGGH